MEPLPVRATTMELNGLNGNEKRITDNEPNVTLQPDIDTTPVPMELEPELSGSAAASNNNENSVVSMTTSQVDLESELREFLEGGGGGNLTDN